jgi:hypothetical protein
MNLGGGADLIIRLKTKSYFTSKNNILFHLGCYRRGSGYKTITMVIRSHPSATFLYLEKFPVDPASFVVVNCFILETGSYYVALAVLELTLQTQRSACLCLQSAGIKDMQHHATETYSLRKNRKRIPFASLATQMQACNVGFMG